jgi:AraC-like DNA-binding protein
MTRPLHLTESARAFGVRFRPGWAAAIIGMPLAPLTDQRVEIGTLQTLANQIAEAKDDRAREALLRAWTERRATPDKRVIAAIDVITRSGGRASIDDVAATGCATRQHLARLFAHHVGVSPKVFARVTRFRRALRLGRTRSGSELAAELGYFDQSHLIDEFREFAGTTPVPFFLSASAERG